MGTGTGAGVDLRATVDNPFRESALGYHLWAKGWRPCSVHTCSCGKVNDVKFRVGKDLYCADPTCKRTLLPFWEHESFPEALPAWEIWRRIVLKKWGVDMGKQATQYAYTVREELTEDEKERLKQERII